MVILWINSSWKNSVNGELERIAFWTNSEFNELAIKIKEFGFEDGNHVWQGWKFLVPEINFTTFSKKDTLQLINDKDREICIKKIWEEILDNTKNCQDPIREHF